MPGGALPERSIEYRDWALVANGSLKVNDRVSVVRSDSGYAAIANRRYPTEIGADAAVGTVVTRGAPFLRDRAKIYGDLIASGVPTVQNLATILVTGSWYQQSPLAEDWRPILWQPELPKLSTKPDVTVGSGGPTRDLPPGEYRRVMVYPGGSLRLQPGRYVVEDLWLEPNATLLFSTGPDPVEILVKGHLIHRGIVTDEAPLQDRVGLVVTCTNAHWFHIEASFQGTILAPNGTLVLGSRYHRGQFIAHSIEVHQDAVVTLAPAYRRPVAADLALNPEIVVGGSGSVEDPYLVARDNPEFIGTVALRPGTGVTGGGCRQGATSCRWNWWAGPVASDSVIEIREHVLAANPAAAPARRTTQLLPLIPDAVDAGMSMFGPGSVPWRTRGGALRRHDAMYEVRVREHVREPAPWVEPGSAPRLWMRLAPHVDVVPVVVARPVDATGTFPHSVLSRTLDLRERDRQLLDGLAPIMDTGGAIDGQYLAAISTWAGGFEPYTSAYGDVPWAADRQTYAPDEVFAQCEEMIDPDSGELMPVVVQFQAVAMLDVPHSARDYCQYGVPAWQWNVVANELGERPGGRGVAEYLSNGGGTVGLWQIPQDCGMNARGWQVGNTVTIGWAGALVDGNVLAHEFGHGFLRTVPGSDSEGHLSVPGNLMTEYAGGVELLPGQCPVAVGYERMASLLDVLDAGPVGLCRTHPRAGALGMEALAPEATASACALRGGGGDHLLDTTDGHPVCCRHLGTGMSYLKDDGTGCDWGWQTTNLSSCTGGVIVLPPVTELDEICCRVDVAGGAFDHWTAAADCLPQQVRHPSFCDTIIR